MSQSEHADSSSTLGQSKYISMAVDFTEIETEEWVKHTLTLATILLTASGLLYSWRKDRQLRRTELADKIRAEAAKILGALERWREASMLPFIEIQPTILKTVDKLFENRPTEIQPKILTMTTVEKRNEHTVVVGALNILRKEINQIRSSAKKTLVDENVTAAYTGLYAYCPLIRLAFVQTMQNLIRMESGLHEALLTGAEEAIDSFCKKEKHNGETFFILKQCTSAKVREKLRETVSSVESSYVAGLDKIISPFILGSQSIILDKDDALLDAKNRDKPFFFICPVSGDMRVAIMKKGVATSINPNPFALENNP